MGREVWQGLDAGNVKFLLKQEECDSALDRS